MNNIPTIGVSDFYRSYHTPDSGRTVYLGSNDHPATDEGLIGLVEDCWENRVPGAGRTDTSKVVLVPIPPGYVRGTTVFVTENMVLEASLGKARQEGEERHISVAVTGQRLLTSGGWVTRPVEPDPLRFAKVVVYSKEALLENKGKRTTDCDWEIVSLIASDVKNQPMHPLAMSRNYLQKQGGTFAEYSAKDFAEAIWYWSQRCGIKT